MRVLSLCLISFVVALNLQATVRTVTKDDARNSNVVSNLRLLAVPTDVKFASDPAFSKAIPSTAFRVNNNQGKGFPELFTSGIASDNHHASILSIESTTAPTITSFSPTTGSQGQTITLTGTNFNTTASQNIVFFGATKATVTAATTTSLSVTVPAGATFGPVTVLNTATLLSGASTAFFTPVFTPAKSGFTACDLSAKVDFTTSSYPLTTALGDLDGDGKTDIAVANTYSNTVSVFRNTSTSGTINSFSFSAKVDFYSGSTPGAVAIADLNSDGKPEMVVANQSSNSVSVFQNNSSPGSISTSSFSSAINISTGANPYSLAIGDLDGDGKNDLVVTNLNAASVSIIRNVSTTTSLSYSSFSPKVDFSVGTSPYSVDLGDLDGDGKADLVVANINSNTVSILRNTTTTGAFTNSSFAPKVDFATGPSPDWISIADIDGDGKADLAITNASGSSVSVFRNTSSAGSISSSSFATKVDFLTESNPYAVEFADIDGDGKTDMVVSNGQNNTLSVFRNTAESGSIGSSSFSGRVDFNTGSFPRSLAAGDLDGDGKPDVVVTNSNSNTISVLRNSDIPSTPPPVVLSFSPTSGCAYQTTLTIEGSNLSDVTGVLIGGVAVNTFTINSDNQITATAAGISGQVSVVKDCKLTTGSQTFTITNCSPVVVGFTPASGSPGQTITISGSNFSTTPSQNIIFFGSARVFATSATSTSMTVTVPAGATYAPIRVLNTATSLTGSSAGFFTPVFIPVKASFSACDFSPKTDFTSGNGSGNGSVAIGDLDGDGKADMVVANNSSNTVSVFRNTSTTGSITSGSFGSKVDFSTVSAPKALTIGDLDGDGKPDLIVSGGNSISILRNTTLGGSITSSSFATKVDFLAGADARSAAIGDLDGDGKPEIVVSNYGSNTISVFRNTSLSGGFTARSFQYKTEFSTGTNPSFASIADLDGDQKPDVVVSNYNANTISVYRNTSAAGNFNSSGLAAPVEFATGTNPAMVVCGDIDRDGKTDLIVPNFSSNSMSILQNQASSGSIGAGSFGAKVDFTTGNSPSFVAITDLNGDSKPDLGILNNSSATASLFLNTSTSGSIGNGSFAQKVDYSTGISGSNPTTLAFADLEGDGQPEMVFTYGQSLVSVLRNIEPTPPTIASFTPSSGCASSAAITLTGTNLSGINSVSIGGIPANNFTVNSATQLTITPSGSSGQITISNYCSSVSSTGSFEVQNCTPVITSINPVAAKPGETMTITGSNFNASASQNVVTFGSVRAAVSAASTGSLSVTIPSGAAYGPVSVLNSGTSLSGASSASFIPTYNTPKDTLTTCDFLPKLDFTTGYYPYAVAVGDLDGDGKADLAVANSNTVSVLRNTSANGTITNGSFAAKVDFTGSSPYSIAIGDLDGDGKPDLAVSNLSSNTVSVFRNASTAGIISFAARVDFTTGSSPYSVAIGDLDGDGKPDLAVANAGSNTVSVLRNTSISSTITASSFASKVDFATGNYPYAIAIGDLDGDGKSDMAVTNLSSNTVSVFRNTSAIGSISASSFAGKVDFTTGSSSYSVSIGDLDRDGKPDLAVANAGSSSISVYRNTAISGALNTTSFSAKVDISTGAQPYAVTIADVTGDGKPDLISANQNNNSVSIIRNKSLPGIISTGSFAPLMAYAVGAYPKMVVAGDLDGDGLPELVTANSNSNSVSVLKNKLLSPNPIISGFSPSSGCAGTSSFTLTGSNFSEISAVTIGGVSVPSFTVNSETEIVITVDGITGPVGLTKNCRTVTSAASFTVNNCATTIATVSPLSGKAGDAVTITGTNFNTDPSQNVVFFGAVRATVSAASATSLTVNVPVGATYAPVTVLNTATRSMASARNVFNPVFSPAKTGITSCDLQPKTDFTSGSSPYSVAIGDLDGDGKADLAVANGSSYTVSVFRNTSVSGTLTTSSFAAKVDFTTGTTPYSVAIGDLDGDGKPDMAVANYSSGTVSVFRNTSTSGSISFAARVDFATGSYPYSIAIGDLDGDGKPDLAIANYGSSTVSVLRNTSANGTITASSFATKVDFTTGSSPRSVAIGDLDGDGKADLVLANLGSYTVSVLRNTSVSGTIATSSFANKVDFATGSGPSFVAIGDLDGDGKSDLAVANVSGNTISVLRNTSTSGSSSFAPKVDFSVGSYPYYLAIGDLDGDGKPDLVASNNSSSSLSILRNTSVSGSITTSSFAAKADAGTGSGSNAVAIGDLDGDGMPDLAVVSGSNLVSVHRNGVPVLPTITGISPTSVCGASATITISGTNLNGVTAVRVGGTAVASFTINSDNQITAVVNGNSGVFSVSTYCTAVSGTDTLKFANCTPTITSFTPAAAAPGASVTLTGSNFNAQAALNVVYFGAAKATVTSATANSLMVTVPSGATYAPITVLNTATGLSGASLSSFIPVYSPAKTDLSSCDFKDKVDFTTNDNPYSVAFGDIDGDGKPDMAVANSNSYTVSVYRNISATGSLSSNSFAAKVDLSLSSPAFSVAFADLDGDGKQDLIVANSYYWGSSNVSVFRNIATNGSLSTASFAPRIDLGLGSYLYLYHVAVGDLDGDGKPDLAVPYQSNSGSSLVAIFRNNSSSGVINFVSSASLTLPNYAYPYSVAIGDLDGDNKSDLVIANQNINISSISLFRNISVSGSLSTSSFATRLDLATGTNPYYLAMGDLDGDGKQDLAVANRTSNTVSLFRNTAISGSLSSSSFAAKVDLSTGTSPRSVSIADLNGDGKPDLVVANDAANTISVFRNTAVSGSLSSSSFASKLDFPAGTNPYSVAVGDLDADGLPELASANYGSNTVSILKNILPDSLPSQPVITSFSPSSVCASFNGTITISGSGFSKVNSVTIAGNPVVSFVVNSDNQITATLNKVEKGVIRISNYCKAGQSNDTLLVLNCAPVISSLSSSKARPGEGIVISGSNFNTSAVGNVVMFGAVRAVVSAASATSLSVTVPVGSTYAPVSVLNNSSGLSGASISSFNPKFIPPKSDFTGSDLAPKVDFPTGSSPYSVAVGDLDGDGKSDLVVANYSSNVISVYRNTSSTGSITSSSFSAKVDFSTGASPYTVAIGDLDGDGKPDLAVANYGSSSVSVYRNNSSTGSITSSSFTAKVDFATGTNPTSIAIGDLDGDGKADLAVSNSYYYTNTISVFRNTSVTGSINGNSFAAKVDLSTGQSPYAIAIGELDGDGKPDLAVANYGSSSVSVFRNKSISGTITNSSFASRVDFLTGSYPRSLAIGDLEGDGKSDLVLVNNGSNSISIFQNNAIPGIINSNSFASRVDFTTSNYPTFVSIGELTGDGRSDMVVVNQNSNSFTVYQNNLSAGSISGNGFVPVNFSTGSSPFAAGIGDLDGDSKSDIVVTNSSSYSISVFRNTDSQLPYISDFTPTSGCAGTASITINGANLAAASAVRIGGTNVSSFTIVSESKITATVGNGTKGLISIITPFGTASSADTFTVHPKPTVSITPSGPTSFCSGQNVTLTASAGQSYQWTPGGQTTQAITVTQSGIYTAKVFNAQGCFNTASQEVSVISTLPVTITASGPTTFCNGDSVTLTASGASSYVWNPGGKTTASIKVKTGGNYTVTGTTSSCTGTASQVVTVNTPSIPTISASGPLSFCSGGSVVLTSSSPSGNQWSTGETTSSITVSTSGSYSVKRTDANGCLSGNSSPVTVTVSPAPTVPTITASGPTTFCEGNNVVLTSSATSANTWSNGSTSESITVTSSGNYTVTVGTGCTRTSSATVVNVTPQTKGTFASIPAFCAGSTSPLLPLTSTNGISGTWNPQTVSNTSSGTYVFTPTSGSCIVTTSLPVTVNQKVNPVFGSIGPIAYGTTAPTLPATSQNGISGTWNPATVSNTETRSYTFTPAAGQCGNVDSIVVVVGFYPDCPQASSPAQNSVNVPLNTSLNWSHPNGVPLLYKVYFGTDTVNWQPVLTQSTTFVPQNGQFLAENTTYYWKVISVNSIGSSQGCITRKFKTVTCQLPQITYLQGDNFLCPGEVLQMDFNATNSFYWTRNGSYLSIAKPLTVTSGGIYVLNTSDLNGCSKSATVSVNSEGAVRIQSSSGITICQGQALNLSVSGTQNRLWNTGSSNSSLNLSPQQSTLYTVSGISTGGCSFFDSLRITVNPSLPPGTVTNMVPVNGTSSLKTPFNLSWLPGIYSSSFDVFVWESGFQRPAAPTFSGISTLSSQISNLKNGVLYNWQVVAKNGNCNSTEGPVQTFQTGYNPDLEVREVTAPTSPFSGQTISVSWVVKNRGKGKTTINNWQDQVFLSRYDLFENHPPGDDVLLGSVSNPVILDSSESYTSSLTAVLPNGIASNYRIIVKAAGTGNLDYSGPWKQFSMQEDKDSNNLRSSIQMNVLLSPPTDFQITSLVTPINGFSGKSINVKYTVKNFGTNVLSKTWQDKIYISFSPSFSAQSSILLKTISKSGNLYKDSSYSETQSVIVPSYIFGNYYLYFQTDASNQLYESPFEDNNIGSDVVNIYLTPPPDLKADFIEPSDSSTIFSPGNNISFTFKYTNIGANPADNSFTNAIYRRNPAGDSVLLFNDNFSFPSTQLAFGEFIQKSNSYSIPQNLSDGEYNLVFSADNSNSLFEYLSENNNSVRSKKRFKIRNPDLTIDEITLPDSARSGQSISISWKVRNIGEGKLLSNYNRIDKIYISPSPVFNISNATFLKEQVVAENLNPGEASSRTADVVIPNGISGTYYLFVFVDNSNLLSENGLNSNNSRSRSLPLKLSSYPDLRIISVSVPDSVKGGTKIPVRFTVKNFGAAEATGTTWLDRVFVSRNPVYTPSACFQLGSFTRTQSLASGATYTISDSVLTYMIGPMGLVDLDYGFFHIVSDATNQVYEYNSDGNNSLVSDSVYFFCPGHADLSVENYYSSDSAIAGSQASAWWTVKNLGNNTSGWSYNFWYDGIFLSRDTVWDPSDLFVNDWTYPGPLAKNQTYSDNKTFTIPYGTSGNYYLLLVTDHKRYIKKDPNRANNYKLNRINPSAAPKPFKVIPYVNADIENQVLMSPANAISGQALAVKYSIKNTGLGRTNVSTWKDALYLSNNSILDPSDFQLGYQNHSGFLNPGEVYTDSITVVVPLSYSGNYVLILKSDNDNVVFEANSESNNVSYTYISASVPAPGDLIVTNISSTDTIFAGDSLAINYSIVNQGVNPVSGFFTDGVFLSEDENWDAGDASVAANLKTSFIPAGGSKNWAVKAIPSNPKLGLNQIIVRADVLNNIPETNEQNNNAVSGAQLYVDARNLPLNSFLNRGIPDNQFIYYKVKVPGNLFGQTLLITVKGDSLHASNELYVRYGALPTRNSADFSFSVPNYANQEILVPEADSGYYYIGLSGVSTLTPQQQIKLSARILPFAITRVFQNRGGNTGSVTVELTGSKFGSNMMVRLEKAGQTPIMATNLIFINSSRVFVSFNLREKALGLYDVVAIKGLENTRLSGSFTVEAGSGGGFYIGGQNGVGGVSSEAGPGCDPNAAFGLNAQVQVTVDHPATTRINRLNAMTIRFGNAGNVDIPVPTRMLYALAGAPLGFTVADLSLNQQELYLEFKEANGPPGILRPGATGAITIYTKAIAPMSFSLKE
jgi:6-phosphogluconolactonase (cycloisomerase 2 family)